MNQGDGFSPVVGVAVFLGVFAPRAEAPRIQSIDLHKELSERETERERPKLRMWPAVCSQFTGRIDKPSVLLWGSVPRHVYSDVFDPTHYIIYTHIQYIYISRLNTQRQSKSGKVLSPDVCSVFYSFSRKTLLTVCSACGADTHRSRSTSANECNQTTTLLFCGGTEAAHRFPFIHSRKQTDHRNGKERDR